MAVRDRIMFAKLLSEYTWGIIFRRTCEPTDNIKEIFADFYALAKKTFQTLDMEIEYCLLGQLDSHYKHYNAKCCENRLNKLGDRVEALRLANMIVMPDTNMDTGLSNNEITIRVDLHVREKFVRTRPDFIENVIAGMAALTPWDYGYAIRRKYSRSPEIFLIGDAFGTVYDPSPGIKKKEAQILGIWQETDDEVRKRKLRDIFEYNVLNQTHKEKLLAVMPDLQTALTKLPNDLFLLKTDKRSQKKLREKLQGTGVLVY